MARVDVDVVHETRTRVYFSPEEVQRILVWAAMESARQPKAHDPWNIDYIRSINSKDSILSAVLRIEQDTIDSPARRTDSWHAHVSITEKARRTDDGEK